ncbi:MAG: DUF2817 domain-containing protein [Phycisphaerales bacterium]|nr:MAG: DUF2817 domain-containing protein [Phycisphaerales bacterium]
MVRKSSLLLVTIGGVGCLQEGRAPQPWKPAPVAFERTLLGYSVQGRPIDAYSYGWGADPVLVFGGFHGNEKASVHVAEKLIALLQGNSALPAGRSVVIVPNVNPDGYERNSRQNARGVDLNRNFPAANWKASEPGNSSHGGSAPLSEPEAQIVLDLVGELKPSLIISIHSISRNRQCNNFDGPGRAVARRMATRNGYPVKASIGYATPGSFGTWAGKELQIPTVTLELPRPADANQCWADNRGALMAAFQGPLDDRALGK